MQLRATRLTAIASAVKRAIKAFSVRDLFAGGAPGVWYDPSDIKLDWRYNLLTRTEEFDNAAWSKTGFLAFGSGSVANTTATLDPLGGNTADLLVENSSTSSHEAYSADVTGQTGTAYTLSRYVKAGAGSRWFMLAISESASAQLCFGHFQPSTNTVGVIGTSGAQWTDVSFIRTDVGNGWYRLVLTATLTSAATITDRSRLKTGDGTTSSYTGDGTSSMYWWGASLTTAADASKPYQRITDGTVDYFAAQPQPVLFQDSAGTTPVTAVEQPVGLMLDKSQGLVLGPTLVVNGDFSNGTTGWTPSSATISASSGELLLTNTGAAYGSFSRTIATVVGKTYSATATMRVETAASTFLIARTTPTSGNIASVEVASTTNTTRTFYFTAVGTTTYIVGLNNNTSGGTAYFDNISVKELAGNHAFQATSASRPVLSARYNLWTNTETLATQNRTVRAAKHIISFSGTGTVILSGAFIGTLVGTGANNRVYLEFTTTAGTLTATVSGSVTKAQLEEV